MGVIIGMIDTLVVLFTMVFITCLKRSQRAYLDNFKDQTIEMDDFTI